jgi:hypothetical protein
MRALKTALILFVLLMLATPAKAARITLYNADPYHPLNMMHETLFVRIGPNGEAYGADRMDPLLWKNSRFLLEGESLANATQALRDVVVLPSEEIAKLSLRQRAILQRDLWAVFDSIVNRGEPLFHWRILELLSTLMQKVALTKAEFETLSRSVKYGNRQFTDSLGEHGFVELASANPYPIAASHVGNFDGRSTFLVFMKTAGGENGVYRFLKSILDFPNPLDPDSDDKHPPLNPKLPMPSPGTEFLIFRLANLILKDGSMVGSPIVEMFSMMKSREYLDGVYFDRFSRSVLSHQKFFTTEGNGLRGVSNDEKDFVQFLAPPDDPFEKRSAWNQVGVLKSCTACHTQMGSLKFPGMHAIQSYARDFFAPIKTKRVDPLIPAGQTSQFELTKAWKQSQQSFRALMEFGSRNTSR